MIGVSSEFDEVHRINIEGNGRLSRLWSHTVTALLPTATHRRDVESEYFGQRSDSTMDENDLICKRVERQTFYCIINIWGI